MRNSLLLLMVLCFTIACQKPNESFVKIQNEAFIVEGESYEYIGANYWQGMNLGAPVSGDRARLIRELDEMQALGITNLRILAASEADEEMKYAIHPALQTAPGKYDEDLWLGLDFLLSEMGKRNMKAVMVLGNFWTWSGGFPQYLKWSGQGEIPYPQDPEYSWQNFTDYSKQFYFNKEAQEMMNNHIRTIISRKNSITGLLYKEDPNIMSWQLSNEPRGYDVPEAYRKWVNQTADLIKSLDKNHLVCIGSEGNTSGKTAGVNALLDNENPSIDYITMHIWAQNWGWFNPTQGEEAFVKALNKVDAYWEDHIQVAKTLKKPIVLEEFGIARDSSSYDPEITTYWRDRYFDYVFNKVSKSIEEGQAVKGLNFWSYSGEGRPPRPGEFWEKGDVFLGDPPHELQGWYGVYNSDKSTLKIISTYGELVSH